MTQGTQYSMFRLAFTIWLLLSFIPALPLPMLATQTLLGTKVPGTCCIDYLGTRCCLTDYLPTSYVLARYQLRTNTNFCLCYPQNTCVITNLHAPDFLTARYIVATCYAGSTTSSLLYNLLANISTNITQLPILRTWNLFIINIAKLGPRNKLSIRTFEEPSRGDMVGWVMDVAQDGSPSDELSHRLKDCGSVSASNRKCLDWKNLSAFVWAWK